MLWSRLQRYRFDWKVTLLVLLLLPLLLRLGYWQLSREQEKLALQDSWQERQSQQAVALESLDVSADLQYRQVLMSGSMDNEHVFLLDNRTWQGQAGYEVLTPLLTDSQTLVLVNRGWIAQGQDRSVLPEIPEVPGRVTVRGSIYVPVGDQLVLGDITAGEGWPKRLQRLQMDEIAQYLQLKDAARLFPYSVRLAEGEAGVLERNWTVISTSPEKHRGYAVQWFAMSGMLLLLYFLFSTRLPDQHR